ncbi:MAG: hypothetical protein P1U57_06965 [Oleibacter sp.]|nr:hypothetical protein [Thalassolituus sp.]
MRLTNGELGRDDKNVGSRYRFQVINENKNTDEITRFDDFLSFGYRGQNTVFKN